MSVSQNKGSENFSAAQSDLFFLEFVCREQKIWIRCFTHVSSLKDWSISKWEYRNGKLTVAVAKNVLWPR